MSRARVSTEHGQPRQRIHPVSAEPESDARLRRRAGRRSTASRGRRGAHGQPEQAGPHGHARDPSTPTTAQTRAVKGVDLEYARQRVTAMIGPSGCGKSTIVRCINRMHEEIPGARCEGSGAARRRRPLRPGGRRHRRAPRDRHGLPEAQPVPDDVDLRQRRRGPAADEQAVGDLGQLVEASLRGAGLWDEVKDRLEPAGHRALRRPAAAPVHRPRDRRRARGAADGRAVLGARPDRDAEDRGADRTSSSSATRS